MDATIVTDITYADAETRGKLRAWKRKLAERYSIFDLTYQATLAGHGAATAIVDLVKGSRSIRANAVDKLTRAWGPGATFEWAKLKRHEAVAVWSILKPRSAVTVQFGKSTPEKERASLSQDCVSVNYIVAGTKSLLIGEGMWTMEVPDHALGRAVERSRFLTPEAIIREAHLNLLDMPIVREEGVAQTPYVKAGPGVFVGEIRVAEDIKVGLSAHCRVSTWLSDDMLGSDQKPIGKGQPGNRMRDSVLVPRPLWPHRGGLA